MDSVITKGSVQSYKKRRLIAGDIINLKAAIKHPGFTTKTWTLSFKIILQYPLMGKSSIQIRVYIHIYIYIHIYNIYIYNIYIYNLNDIHIYIYIHTTR